MRRKGEIWKILQKHMECWTCVEKPFLVLSSATLHFMEVTRKFTLLFKFYKLYTGWRERGRNCNNGSRYVS
jgi:hypothetical protein